MQAEYTLGEIDCTCENTDWVKYPNTGHQCDHHLCYAEATVAVFHAGSSRLWMVCEDHKPPV